MNHVLTLVYFVGLAITNLHGFSLRIPQHQMHQVLPLGTNATVSCLPEPMESRPSVGWTIDSSIPYEPFKTFYNSKGIVVHLTVDNISFVVVEGRQENIVPGGRKFTCNAFDDNQPVVSDTAVVEFYGPPTPPTTLTVNITSSLSLLLSWQPSQGRNVTYELTVSRIVGGSSEVVSIVLTTATLLVYNVSNTWCKHYVFVVRAINPAGTSNVSDAVTALIPSAPPAVQLEVGVHNITTNTIVINISPIIPQCGQHYDSTVYFVNLTRYNNTTLPLNVSSAGTIVTDVMKGVVYTLTLETRNTHGHSSDEITICLSSAPILNGSAIVRNTTHVHFSWIFPANSDPQCVHHYVVNVSSWQSTTVSVITTNATYLVLGPLEIGKYIISVAGIDHSNLTGEYNTFTVDLVPMLAAYSSSMAVLVFPSPTPVLVSTSPSSFPQSINNAGIIATAAATTSVVVVALVLTISLLALYCLKVKQLNNLKPVVGKEMITTDNNVAYSLTHQPPSSQNGNQDEVEYEQIDESSNKAYATVNM